MAELSFLQDCQHQRGYQTVRLQNNLFFVFERGEGKVTRAGESNEIEKDCQMEKDACLLDHRSNNDSASETSSD